MKNKIILKKLSYLFLSLALIATVVSCDQVESVPDDSDIVLQDIVAEWVVDIDWAGDFYDFNTISTYNTSDNSATQMWLDDQQHGWGLKAKVNVDGLTFSGENLPELYYGVTVTITNGVIVKNAATSPSGDVVDSISFNAEFSDIPGEIWTYSGRKSTGKIADLP